MVHAVWWRWETEADRGSARCGNSPGCQTHQLCRGTGPVSVFTPGVQCDRNISSIIWAILKVCSLLIEQFYHLQHSWFGPLSIYQSFTVVRRYLGQIPSFLIFFQLDLCVAVLLFTCCKQTSNTVKMYSVLMGWKAINSLINLSHFCEDKLRMRQDCTITICYAAVLEACIQTKPLLLP